MKRWGRGFADASSQRLALYYVIGLVALVTMALSDWPGFDKGEWADIFAVSAMIAAVAAGTCQGGAFLVISAIRLYNNRLRNEARHEARTEILNALEQKNLITAEQRRRFEQEQEQEQTDKT